MRYRNLFSLLVVLLIGVTGVVAQTPTPTPVNEDDEPIRISSRLVMVPVSVTDANGLPVAGLTEKDFVLSEEGRTQLIERVSDADKVPLEIALLFDVSASTDSLFVYQQETAIKFLQDVMRPEDRASVFTIGERPLLVQSRQTADQAAVAIRSIVPAKKFTAFYDTVRLASEYLDQNSAAGTCRVVVVISDGEDTNSAAVRDAINDGYRKLGKKFDTMTSKELYEFTVKSRNDASVREQTRVLRTLQNADTVFYSINPAGSSFQLNKMSMFGQNNLERFANQTGGTAFLPKFQPIGLKDGIQNEYNLKQNQEMLTVIFRKLANELRAQYLVQYYSDAEFPTGRYVTVKVGLSGRPALRLRTREGYFVK